MRRLRIPATLSVILLSGCGSHASTPHDAKLADATRCPIDAPLADANGCARPCGDITGGTGLCHGMEVCVDPCGGCPPGCAPLV